MASDPSDHRRTLLGLAAILTVAAGVVTVGTSLQERKRAKTIEATTTTTMTTTLPTVAPAAGIAGTGMAPGSVVAMDGDRALTGRGAATVTVRMAAPDARPLRVVAVSLVADPAYYEGRCPTTIRFHGTIHVEGHGRASYRFGRSDRARGPVQKADVNSWSVAPVETSWTLGGQAETPFEGWQTLEIVAPGSLTSPRAAFRITCVP